MTGHSIARNPLCLVLASLLCLAGVWLYAQRVLVAHQIADAAAHDRPRGNLSDLYPRWLGARELLLHGRDPYSAEVTREIQAGYYGRVLNASRSGDPKDQQGFAYPVYVVFYLAPTVHLRFDVVRKGFFWVLLGLTVASVPLWLRVLRWPASPLTQVSMAALTVGSLAVMQGLKLQQMTLFVAALIAIAMALLATHHAKAAGVLLALATIKPQLVGLLLVWLAIWTAGDWKRRYRWAVSFLVTMTILVAAAEMWLPHWIPRFWQAAREYLNYTEGVPLLRELIPSPWSKLVALSAGVGAVAVCWRKRKCAADSAAFPVMTCLVLSVTLLIIPTYALYNQVLLLPALLMLAREPQAVWRTNLVSRVFLVAVAILLGWPWLASIVLAVLSFVLPPQMVQEAWAVPGWTVLTLPVSVAALMLVVSFRGSSAASPERTTA
jgi:Glycosyltransferase family 87